MFAKEKRGIGLQLLVIILLAMLLAVMILGYFQLRQREGNPSLQGGETTTESTDTTETTGQEAPPDTQEVVLRTAYTKNFAEATEYADVLNYHAGGKLFGWEDRMTDGCSTWCSVSQYTVNAIASSTLKPHGAYSYPATNVTVENRENAWAEGAEGSGIGEYIELEHTCTVGTPEYETDIGFTELCIVNGYAVTETGWEENNRVKALKLYFKQAYVAMILLEDTILPQYIDISSLNLKVENGESANFKFEISEVYRGTKYDDTCITGLLIEFSGRTGH